MAQALHSTPPKRTSKPSALASLVAGSTAGAIEIAVTYPFEFAKTHAQLNQRLSSAQKVPWPPLGAQWYAGCTTLIIGNALKAGIRFVAFDGLKSLLQDQDGKLSGPRTLLAGFGAGLMESLFAVTPFESIKTQLIDDRKRSVPRMKGFLHGSALIAREQGIHGFLKGLVPTTARQAANSAVRFGTYSTLKDYLERRLEPGEKLGAVPIFGIGAIAGLVTVYTTQPIDTIKTRMQSIEAKKHYKNSLACAAQILRNEGVRTLWSGAVPRLGRLLLSGGIVFTVYEKSIEAMKWIDPEKRFL